MLRPYNSPMLRPAWGMWCVASSALYESPAFAPSSSAHAAASSYPGSVRGGRL